MKITEEELEKSFQELYLIEKKARDYYGNLLIGGLSGKEKETIQEIHDDEVKHMEIVKEILEVIKEPS